MIGKTIGQYQLIEYIARGETSIVYKGFQPAMNRYVAVKVLSPALARSQALAQEFQREAELIAQLEHPNILPIYDFGSSEGASFMVSRFIESGTLRDHLFEFYSPQEALRLLRPIAEALDYIHGRGITHGNLEPSNILIDPQRRPVLTDFGFVRKARTGWTPEDVYRSPEQVAGASIDQRTDVYALGVLLYEMLIGEPPSIGLVPSPRLKRPDLPDEVEKVILKAMAQYPEQRFQTASGMIHALEMAVTPIVPSMRQPASFPEPVPAAEPQPRRDLSWLIFLLGGVFVVLLILAVFLLLSTRTDDESAVVATPTVTLETPVVEPPTQPPPVETPTQEPTEEPPVEPPTEEPPVEPPTEEPPVEPPTEEPPIEPPTEEPPVEPPEATPTEESGSGPNGGICGSVVLPVGLVLAGLAVPARKRWSKRGRD